MEVGRNVKKYYSWKPIFAIMQTGPFPQRARADMFSFNFTLDITNLEVGNDERRYGEKKLNYMRETVPPALP